LAAVAPRDVRVVVIANDTQRVESILSKRLWRLVVSPGPGNPSRAGVSVELIARAQVPTLGVCLGHQCLAYAFGGRIVRGTAPVHGKPSRINHNGAGIFRGLPPSFSAARYHSLVVEEASLPSCLVVTARSEDGVIMALRHRRKPIAGVQFHPESVLTEHGATIARNFLDGHV